jgi:hypothetical protein
MEWVVLSYWMWRNSSLRSVINGVGSPLVLDVEKLHSQVGHQWSGKSSGTGCGVTPLSGRSSMEWVVLWYWMWRNSSLRSVINGVGSPPVLDVEKLQSQVGHQWSGQSSGTGCGGTPLSGRSSMEYTAMTCERNMATTPATLSPLRQSLYQTQRITEAYTNK